jgi:hypothetical protein
LSPWTVFLSPPVNRKKASAMAASVTAISTPRAAPSPLGACVITTSDYPHSSGQRLHRIEVPVSGWTVTATATVGQSSRHDQPAPRSPAESSAPTSADCPSCAGSGHGSNRKSSLNWPRDRGPRRRGVSAAGADHAPGSESAAGYAGSISERRERGSALGNTGSRHQQADRWNSHSAPPLPDIICAPRGTKYLRSELTA